MTVAVKVDRLVKVYKGGTRALDGISFEVEEREIFGLIGPNGAGKTTTLRIAATLLQPTSGTVTVFGVDVTEDPGKVREMIGYLPEDAGAYRNLTGYEFLRFVASFRAKSKPELEDMLSRAEKISALGESLGKRVKTYSKGMLRRLLVAASLMHTPRLAILDEPTTGLDVVNAVRIRDIIRSYARREGVTVLLSSHNMLEVEYLCDRVAIIHRGRIVAMGAPEDLKNRHGAPNLEKVFVEVTGGGAFS